MTYFKDIPKIKYEGKNTSNMYAFRYYNPDEIILEKPMKEHLKFAVAYWHTMTADGSDPFGVGTYERTWFGSNEMETALNRVDAFFELLVKLDVEYFCFHDVDIAPQGSSLEEFFANLDQVTDYIKKKMDETGIKLLWNTANLFTHPRFVHGGATSNSVDVYAISAAQVKKGLEISKKLQGENYVFWGGREGYESLLNTDMNFELDNLARFYHMALNYKKELNHDPQFLIEPKPKEPTKHQYDYDAATTLAFLQKYNLEHDFKLNLEANHATLAGHTFEHELHVARINNILGSIDANQGDLLLGWDTDEFPTDVYAATLAMYEIVEAGGLKRGGINFDAKVRRTAFSMEDLVLAHIAGMDTFARALRTVAKMKEDLFIETILKRKYSSFDTTLGQEILNDKHDLKSLSDYAMTLTEVKLDSSHLEYIKSLLNDYLV